MIKLVSTKLIVFLLLAGSLCAQDKGMRFFHGTWAELLAEAKKNDKLIFVDVYTEWCGPCKMMVKDVFPLEKVGEAYNSRFINYKLDAEKGEGIELCKKFKVAGYPTYLYLGQDGELLHRGIGFFEPDRFIRNSDVAVEAAKDPVSVGKLTQVFEAGNKDKAFLKDYIGKLIKMQLPAVQPLNDYFAQLTPGEKAKEETKVLLLQALGLQNKEVLAFLVQDPRELKDISVRSGITNSVGFPLIDDLTNNLLMGAFRALENEAYNDHLLYKGYWKQLTGNSDYNKTLIPAMDMDYLAGTGKIDSLHQYTIAFVAGAWETPIATYRAQDAEALTAFLKPYAEGKLDSTKDNYYSVKRNMAARKASQEAAGVLHSASKGFATTKAPVKKKMLDQAFQWNKKALELTPDNDHYKAVTAQLLYKLGKKKEAITIMDALLTKAREEKSPRLIQSMEKVRNTMM